MVNKDIELLFGEDVRVKVEELLDISLSAEEMKKSFYTTSYSKLNFFDRISKISKLPVKISWPIPSPCRAVILYVMTSRLLSM